MIVPFLRIYTSIDAHTVFCELPHVRCSLGQGNLQHPPVRLCGKEGVHLQHVVAVGALRSAEGAAPPRPYKASLLLLAPRHKLYLLRREHLHWHYLS